MSNGHDADAFQHRQGAQHEAGHHGGLPAAGVPGKRTRTEALRGADPTTTIINRLRDAEAVLTTISDRYLPELHGAVDSRRMDDARRSSGALTHALDRVGRDLDYARRCAAIMGSPGALELLAPLDAAYSARKDEAAPLLALAPPAAPAVPPGGAFAQASDWSAHDAAEAANNETWNAQLDARDAEHSSDAEATTNVIDASDRFGRTADPIQRRAAGYPADDIDIPNVAAAGVAGAGGALPHHDTIQQSFGAHDVSAITAHVGGPAAKAAGAIGAEAYATGDHVAFAESPSLFVAAHEAAHVIQQRAGVSLLGGVGAAGDSYEQHADAVAERVVRGESAEALLGRAGAHGGPAALQRKHREEDSTRLTVMKASLLNAQHWLDAGSDALRAGNSPGRDNVAEMLRTSGLVQQHLDEAITTLTDADAMLDVSRVHGRMNEMSRALGEYLELAVLNDTDTGLDAIIRREQQLRELLGLPAYPKPKAHRRASKKDDVYEAAAIAPVIDLAAIEAKKVHRALSKHRGATGDATAAMISEASATIDQHLEQAIWLLSLHDGPGEAKTYGPNIEAASEQVLEIHRWIFGHGAQANLLEMFGRVVKTTNRLRAAVGLGTLAEHDALMVEGKPQLVRIHKSNEMVDPEPSPLYPGDRLQLTAELGTVAEGAAMAGELRDTVGLFAPSTSSVEGSTLTVAAEAKAVGTTVVKFGLGNGLESKTLRPAQAIQVVDALDGDNHEQIVKTNNFDDAKMLILNEIESLVGAQATGAHNAKASLLVKDKKSDQIPWLGELFIFAMESAVSFVTGGLGTRLGKALAAHSGMQGLPAFDIDGAFTTATKDFFKKVAGEAVSAASAGIQGSGGGSGGVVEREWAIDLFCTTQEDTLKKAATELKAAWINKFDVLRQLETAQPGAGLSAIEHIRHDFAGQAEWAKLAQYHETMRQWLLHEANASHGMTPMYDPKVRDADGNRPEGTNMDKQGDGEVEVAIAYNVNDPGAPVTVRSIRTSTKLHQDVQEQFFNHGGTILELGLPIRVEVNDFSLRRNEIGDIWQVINTKAWATYSDHNNPAKLFLFTKGTGKTTWSTDKELNEGMYEGARRILEIEIGGQPTAGLPVVPGIL